MTTSTVTCHDCGAAHPAEFSHLSQYGGHRVYAVVCGDLVDFYTEEVVTVNPYHVPEGTDANFARWLHWLAEVDWVTLTGDEQAHRVQLEGIEDDDPDFWDAVALVENRWMNR